MMRFTVCWGTWTSLGTVPLDSGRFSPPFRPFGLRRVDFRAKVGWAWQGDMRWRRGKFRQSWFDEFSAIPCS